MTLNIWPRQCRELRHVLKTTKIQIKTCPQDALTWMEDAKNLDLNFAILGLSTLRYTFEKNRNEIISKETLEFELGILLID